MPGSDGACRNNLPANTNTVGHAACTWLQRHHRCKPTACEHYCKEGSTFCSLLPPAEVLSLDHADIVAPVLPSQGESKPSAEGKLDT
jgi:hypothetical protein